MQAYSDPKRENDPHALPDVEVFRLTVADFLNAEPGTWQMHAMRDAMGSSDQTPALEGVTARDLAGWYWWSCFPGCMPDSDPIGPFATEAEALADAQADAE